MEGRSLLPAIHGAKLDTVPIISEYHGEGIMRPSFIVRLGDWKYHYCHGSKARLFNIAEDPGEWHDLADDPQFAKTKLELDRVITGGYFDLEKIAQDVWDRLPMKQVVNDAMKANNTHWDYQVEQNASKQFIRS